MKQFQFDYQDENALQHELAMIKKACSRNLNSKVVFQIHSMLTNPEDIKYLTDRIEEMFPEADYFGDESFFTILNGEKTASKAAVICTVFEYPTTKVACALVEKDDPLTEGGKPNAAIKNFVKQNPWAKSMDLVATFKGFVDMISEDEEIDLPEDFCICGGIACRPDDVFSEDHYVFAKGKQPTNTGMVMFLVGGEDYFVENSYTIGWRPLGKHMTITESKGTSIREIDNAPAFEIYKKYLNIQYGPEFAMQAISFPLLVEKAGIDCLITPSGIESDDSISLATKVANDSKVRIGFGDPEVILSSVKDNAGHIIDFAPEIIRVYSCCGRAMYLGDAISTETRTLNGIAPTSGYYTRGEFFYINKHLLLFNYTMVVSVCREGEKVEFDFDVEEAAGNSNVNQFTKYLLNYLDVTSKELEEANEKISELSK